MQDLIPLFSYRTRLSLHVAFIQLELKGLLTSVTGDQTLFLFSDLSHRVGTIYSVQSLLQLSDLVLQFAHASVVKQVLKKLNLVGIKSVFSSDKAVIITELGV